MILVPGNKSCHFTIALLSIRVNFNIIYSCINKLMDIKKTLTQVSILLTPTYIELVQQKQRVIIAFNFITHNKGVIQCQQCKIFFENNLEMMQVVISFCLVVHEIRQISFHVDHLVFRKLIRFRFNFLLTHM